MGLFDWLLGTDQAPVQEQIADAVTPAPPTAEDIEAALTAAESMVADGAASAPIVSRVTRVTTTVRALLPRLETMGVASLDTYNIVATATDYLPESLASYLSLPRDWADTRPVAGGKSSLLLLIDQLDLLATSMSRMYDAANRADASALVAQGKFLDEKFGGHHSTITLDDPRPVSNNPLDLEGA